MHSCWPNTTDLAKEMPLVRVKIPSFPLAIAPLKGHLLCMLFISTCLKRTLLQRRATGGHIITGMQSVELVRTWFPF